MAAPAGANRKDTCPDTGNANQGNQDTPKLFHGFMSPFYQIR
jgi:hypothetical protein